MFKKNHVFATLFVLGLTALGTAVCQAADPLGVSTNITINSPHDCTVTITPVTSSVALKYTLTAENLVAGTAGTYTLASDDGYAKYIVSADTAGDCSSTGISVRLPVVGTATTSSPNYSRALKVGDAELYANAFLADFFATASADGTGTEVDIVGAKYSRDQSMTNGSTLTRASGSWPALVDTSASSGYYTVIAKTYDLSTVGNVITSGYTADGYTGWPRGAKPNNTLPVAFLNGAQSGAYINIPSDSLVGQKSVTVDIGVAVSSMPVVGNAEDVGSVFNGEVFTGKGTVTVTTL